MQFKKDQVVRLKSWDEIAKTLTETNGYYNHKKTGLIVNVACFNEDFGKESVIVDIDEDGDILVEGGDIYYHKDWLDIV